MVRNGSRIAACLVVALGAGVAHADLKTIPVAPHQKPLILPAPQPAARPLRVLSFRSLEEEIDNHVLANLLTDVPPSRPNDIPLSVVAGQISSCEEDTCVVPLAVRVVGAAGPVTLAFAVSNPKGELSEIHHAECGAGACAVSLVLERGNNAISVGVLDGLVKATAYTVLRVNADCAYARAGLTEWF